MSGPDLPEIPAPLKGIQHYLKIATEHDQRDPVVSYWARLYALQTGLKISTKTSAENNFLLKLMDWLEGRKKSLIDNEAITNEVAAQAHLENWALKLFLYADKNDREGNFNKSVIQSFYTAGLLYDVLTTFGDLTEEAAQNRKYSKWKAAYIHNCIKNGEIPQPGPMKTDKEDDNTSNLDADPGPNEDLLLDDVAEGKHAGDEGEDNEADPTEEVEGESTAPDQGDEEQTEPGIDSVEENQSEEPPAEPNSEGANPEEAEAGPAEPGIDPAPSQPTPPPSNNDPYGFPSVPGGTAPQAGGNTSYPTLPTPVNQNPYNPAPTPTSPGVPTSFTPTPNLTGGVTLDPEQTIKASKYIKWAGSALNYDDVPTAIGNLQKALHLLTTGVDS